MSDNVSQPQWLSLFVCCPALRQSPTQCNRLISWPPGYQPAQKNKAKSTNPNYNNAEPPPKVPASQYSKPKENPAYDDPEREVIDTTPQTPQHYTAPLPQEEKRPDSHVNDAYYSHDHDDNISDNIVRPSQPDTIV